MSHESSPRPTGHGRGELRGIRAFYFLTAGTALAAIGEPGLPAVAIVAIWATVLAMVAVHETGHIALALATRRRIRRVRVTPGWGNTVIKGPNPHDVSWIVTALAGSAAAILAAVAGLLLLAGMNPGWLGDAGVRWIEAILTVSLIDSAINLLPCWKFDGRHVYRTIKELHARQVRAGELEQRFDEFLEAARAEEAAEAAEATEEWLENAS